ncbi:MAG TPA: histidine phosphatase family protein, partial [Ilumatobacteraceae bacterium]
MKLILVRHGATEWSTNGRHTGRTDLPLTAEGRAQAQNARAKVLRMIGHDLPTANWSSPLSRAVTTAEIVLGSQSFVLDARLREFDYGDYEGLTTTEIQQTHPGWNVWQGCPGGETVADVSARVDSFLADVRAHGAPVS